MSSAKFGKKQWIEMFREIGLDDEAMHGWHATFEARWPESHRSFLEWLGVGEPEIDRIRRDSRERPARG